MRQGLDIQAAQIKPVGVCRFNRPAALFLVGERGRDADFRADGTLSIWTVAGRKRIAYTVPAALRPLFECGQRDRLGDGHRAQGQTLRARGAHPGCARTQGYRAGWHRLE